MLGHTLDAAERRAAQSGDFGDLLGYLAACELAGQPPAWTGPVVRQLVQVLEVRAAQLRARSAAEVWPRYRALRALSLAAPALSEDKVANRAAELCLLRSETRVWLARFLRYVRASAPAARPFLRQLLVSPADPGAGASATVLLFLGAAGPGRRGARHARPRRLAVVLGLAILVLTLSLAWQIARNGTGGGAGPGQAHPGRREPVSPGPERRPALTRGLALAPLRDFSREGSR
ncbi:hypothetical protein [Phenylobacterium sp. J367]|uniref:hypothetical protein n=1 Tax=Phenylobacterium sp. J367 TaxID=2898435 RepID=UPI0021515972|nr:hypothetical protein [Phenylobacterium sp. J367]MCR5877080.1 hypothetical protein [Phenylobacterium sp. J367]